MDVEDQKKKNNKPIVLKNIVASKNKTLAKLLPRFVYRYLNRLMHIEMLNDILVRYDGVTEMDFVYALIDEFNITVKYEGYENLPESGRYIFAGNHPLGGFDAFLLMKTVYEKLGAFKFLSNDVLLAIPQLKDLFIPVNKHGGHSRNAAKLMDNLYQSDEQVLIFPSGLASRKINGQIVDLEWKKHFISKAIRYKRDVVPIFISGGNSKRFYRIANFRKAIKLKWNLEMFFLPDETLRHRNTHMKIKIGEPIPFETFDKSKSHLEWADWVKEIVYNL